MKNKIGLRAIIVALLFALQSCAVVGGIFKAGAATGAIVIIVVVVLIIFLITRMSKK